MKCEKCKYHYLKKGIESKTVYNSLIENNQEIKADKEYHMCGESPQGIFLDENRPICEKFKELIL